VNSIGVGTIFGICGMISAIFFGYWTIKSYRESARTYKELRSHIYTFDDLLLELAELTKATGKYIKILVDVPSYGHISARESFKEYWDTLMGKAIHDVDIEIVSLNDDSLSKLYDFYFESETEDKIAGYLGECKKFSRSLQEYNAKLYTVDDVIMHIFIFDGDKAVVSFQDYPLLEEAPISKASTIGFETEDKRMIIFFEKIFEEVKRKSAEFKNPPLCSTR
jgi:hypothetical protein